MVKRQRKQRKPAPKAQQIGVFATPERRRKMGGVIMEIITRDATGKAAIKRQKVKVECALDAYLQASAINIPQHEAGMKFRRKSLRFNSGSLGDGSGSREFIDCGRGNVEDRLNARLDRKGKLDKARALLTPAQRAVVERVCGYNKPVHSVEEKAILVQALDILAVHWGFM